jgi:Trehalose utilisation
MTDTEYDWPFYDRLIGTHFKTHLAIQQATIEVSDRSHPSTGHGLSAQLREPDAGEEGKGSG